MLKSFFRLCAALFLIFTFTIFADAPRYGGSVVVAVTMDPGGLNPAVTTQAAVHQVCGSLFNGLVAQDFEFNPVPDLATRWEVSGDGKTYTFYLAENVEFHDGVPLTSADVKFTFEELLLKFHSRTRSSIGDKLRQITTPDAHTVRFEFNTPYAAFLQLIDVTNAPVMPKHLYENTDAMTNPYNTKPVGSGAFKFQEWAKGDHLTLVKNDKYFKTGKPYLDRIVFKVMPSIATAAIAFENGEADYLLNPAPLDIERLKLLPNVVVTGKGREGFASVETLIFNLNRAPLSDVRVRRAMAYAIDKNYLVDKVALGMGIAATGPISTALKWAYNPNVVKYERNLTLANQMLDEAGYKRNADGVRFHLKYVYAVSYAKTIEALRDQLREVGIAVDLEQMEFNAAVERTYIKKDFDLGISSFENGPDPDIGVKRTVISGNIGAIPFSNGAGYRNPRIDELFELAASETDRQKRASYYFEAQDILVKDLPYLWLYESQGAAVYKSQLQGMYQWSAKSSVYFAQDAWWIDGQNPNADSTGKFGQRRLYFFLVVGAIILIVMLAFLMKRRKRKS